MNSPAFPQPEINVLFYLACYDIPEDRLRAQVAKILGEYGNRIQYSVFELMIESESVLDELRVKIRHEVQEDICSLNFYRLCQNCRAASCDLHGGSLTEIPTAIIV